YALVGIVLPGAGAIHGFGGLSWQSGRLTDMVGTVAISEAISPFWPLFLFAFLALFVFLMNRRRATDSKWVRSGLVVGMVLGGQYTLIQFLRTEILAFFGIFIVFTVVVMGELVVQSDKPSSNWKVGDMPDLTNLGSCALIVLCLLIHPFVREGTEPVSWWQVLKLPLFAWPTALLVTFTMARARLRLSERQAGDAPLDRLSTKALYGIFATYGVAWTVAIRRAIAYYNNLPTESPGSCYVATAASRGHRRLVRSEWVEAETGEPFLVNSQLRTLKAGELAIKAVCPRFHRLLRRIYDFMGPPLAQRIRNPWLADLAFIGLVPVTLLTRAFLGLARVPREVSRW
ncbi:MAG: hypothetical protein KDB61_09600, partial [Planctomycetes bacterium]|nr:hypothetical protein [Planctomycetota bacterium]